MPRQTRLNLGGDKALLGLQVVIAAASLLLLNNNLHILVLLLITWAATFRRLNLSEVGLVSIACILFTIMNIITLHQGIFSFTRPDLWGLPAYEFLMWGFYTLHTKRMIGASIQSLPDKYDWLMVMAFALSFASLQNPHLLLAATSFLLIGGLIRHHERRDMAFTGYMILLGVIIELAGVYGGQWSYQDAPAGGIPFWMVTLWGGTGFFLNRVALPLLIHYAQVLSLKR